MPLLVSRMFQIHIQVHLVDKLGKIKIEIYSNEHPPAHFHISANGYKASLAIDNCRVLENSGFNSKVIKNIQDWFLYSKDRLIKVWTGYRDAQKIVMLPLIPEPNKEKVRTAILNYLNLKE